MERRRKNQSGEILTTLTILGVGLLFLGSLISSWAIQRGPLKNLPRAEEEEAGGSLQPTVQPTNTPVPAQVSLLCPYTRALDCRRECGTNTCTACGDGSYRCPEPEQPQPQTPGGQEGEEGQGGQGQQGQGQTPTPTPTILESPESPTPSTPSPTPSTIQPACPSTASCIPNEFCTGTYLPQYSCSSPGEACCTFPTPTAYNQPFDSAQGKQPTTITQLPDASVQAGTTPTTTQGQPSTDEYVFSPTVTPLPTPIPEYAYMGGSSIQPDAAVSGEEQGTIIQPGQPPTDEYTFSSTTTPIPPEPTESKLALRREGEEPSYQLPTPIPPIPTSTTPLSPQEIPDYTENHELVLPQPISKLEARRSGETNETAEDRGGTAYITLNPEDFTYVSNPSTQPPAGVVQNPLDYSLSGTSSLYQPSIGTTGTYNLPQFDPNNYQPDVDPLVLTSITAGLLSGGLIIPEAALAAPLAIGAGSAAMGALDTAMTGLYVYGSNYIPAAAVGVGSFLLNRFPINSQQVVRQTVQQAAPYVARYGPAALELGGTAVGAYECAQNPNSDACAGFIAGYQLYQQQKLIDLAGTRQYEDSLVNKYSSARPGKPGKSVTKQLVPRTVEELRSKALEYGRLMEQYEAEAYVEGIEKNYWQSQLDESIKAIRRAEINVDLQTDKNYADETIATSRGYYKAPVGNEPASISLVTTPDPSSRELRKQLGNLGHEIGHHVSRTEFDHELIPRDRNWILVEERFAYEFSAGLPFIPYRDVHSTRAEKLQQLLKIDRATPFTKANLADILEATGYDYSRLSNFIGAPIEDPRYLLAPPSTQSFPTTYQFVR